MRQMTYGLNTIETDLTVAGFKSIYQKLEFHTRLDDVFRTESGRYRMTFKTDAGSIDRAISDSAEIVHALAIRT